PGPDRFGEVIAGVEEEDVDAGHDARGEVDNHGVGHRGRDAELAAERFRRPADDAFGWCACQRSGGFRGQALHPHSSSVSVIPSSGEDGRRGRGTGLIRSSSYHSMPKSHRTYAKSADLRELRPSPVATILAALVFRSGYSGAL